MHHVNVLYIWKMKSNKKEKGKPQNWTPTEINEPNYEKLITSQRTEYFKYKKLFILTVMYHMDKKELQRCRNFTQRVSCW